MSLYLPDVHSAEAAAHIENDGNNIVVSSLCALEVVNAIHLRGFRNERTPVQVSESIAAFKSDLKEGIFLSVPVPPLAWDTALNLSGFHTPMLGTRSIDILHIATALAIKAAAFVTFDRNQARLAIATGLTVKPQPVPEL